MMQSQIETAFPQCGLNHCIITITDSEFKILDKEEQSPASVHADGTFQVLNPSRKEIQFLAIDKCIFFDSDKFRKCDAGIFDDSIFYFIEIKVVKPRSRNETRKNARKQLLNTIKIFKEKIDFSSYTVYAVYSLTNANTKSYPASNAASLNDSVNFANLGAKLKEGNQIEMI